MNGVEKVDYIEEAKKIKLNSIKINFDVENTEKISIGASKFGGRPDLPEDFKWYYFSGWSPFDDCIKNRPLSFLAQINCEEVKKYDLDNRLPETGMLYFFYDLETMTWGDSPEEQDSAKVYYYSGNISKLVRADYPEDMPEKYRLPSIKLTFESEENIPDYEEIEDICNIYDSAGYEIYDEFKYKGNMNPDFSNKLLGYADSIQGSMIHQCEEVSRKIYCGGKLDITPEEQEEIKAHKSEWKLLFQLGTVSKGDFELMFGDCGEIYFYIKEEDLKNKNFENVWLILQCG